MLDQVEQRRLGPMDVLEHEHDRPPTGTLFERLPDRPKDVFRSACRQGGCELVLRSRFPKDLDERPVRDALAVGETAPEEDLRLVADDLRQLEGEPRLADSGR